MRPIRKLVIYGLCAALFFPLHASAAASEPLELVKGAAEKAIQILKDPKLQAKDKQKERVDRLREALNPIFDFEEMGKRALGAHWRTRTPAEQEEFARLFRSFLERVYADKVDLYKGQKVVIESPSPFSETMKSISLASSAFLISGVAARTFTVCFLHLVLYVAY